MPSLHVIHLQVQLEYSYYFMQISFYNAPHMVFYISRWIYWLDIGIILTGESFFARSKHMTREE